MLLANAKGQEFENTLAIQITNKIKFNVSLLYLNSSQIGTL